jgi:hypothetical protein
MQNIVAEDRLSDCVHVLLVLKLGGVNPDNCYLQGAENVENEVLPPALVLLFSGAI